MRKMSKAAKVEGYDSLNRKCSVYQEFAYLTVNAVAPDAVETVTDTDGKSFYDFSLYACERAHGGIVVRVFRSPVNRGVQVEIELFDDWVRDVATMPYGIGINTDVKIAADRLCGARRRLFDKLKECAV